MPSQPGTPDFPNLRDEPFSRFGSRLAVGWSRPVAGQPPRLVLKFVHANRGEAFEIRLGDSPFVAHAGPSRLRLEATSGGGWAEVALEGDTFVARGAGAPLRFIVLPAEFTHLGRLPAGRWLAGQFGAHGQFLFAATTGRLDASGKGGAYRLEHGELVFGGDGAAWKGSVAASAHGTPVIATAPDFDAVARAADQDWEAFARRFAAASSDPVARRAAFLLWNSTAADGGFYTTRPVLMSKNQMVYLWAWDHAINAAALAPAHPDLAWEQWWQFFRHQRPDGRIPDRIGERELIWDFLKPPIHGWAARELHRHAPLNAPRLREVVAALESWTHHWTDHCDHDGDGLPDYLHGNDSGWDNSTVFCGLGPFGSPELATFLVDQMETIADFRLALGEASSSAAWRERASALLARALAAYWRGDGWATRAAGEEVRSHSLLPHLALFLGRKLPVDIAAAALASLRSGGWRTAHGFATEAPTSPCYEADGYWRGPIWAPPTLFLTLGLRSLGEEAEASALARDFRALCARQGFAENFDALSGVGLRDRGYTWTAAAYLLLAEPGAAS